MGKKPSPISASGDIKKSLLPAQLTASEEES